MQPMPMEPQKTKEEKDPRIPPLRKGLFLAAAMGPAASTFAAEIAYTQFYRMYPWLSYFNYSIAIGLTILSIGGPLYAGLLLASGRAPWISILCLFIPFLLMALNCVTIAYLLYFF